jgi:hypothetical protein
MTATTAKREQRLSAAQAKTIALAENAVQKLDAAIKAARKKRDEIRDRYRHRIPKIADPEDAGRDVRQVEVGNYRIRVSRYSSGRSFSLKDYTAAGNPVTPAMAPFVSEGAEREKWTVTDLRGPIKPGAVETHP